MSIEVTRPARPVWQTLVQLVVGGAVGAAAAWTYAENANVMRWADMVALSLALICLIAATRLFLNSFNRRSLGQLMAVEGDSTSKEATQARFQAVLLVCLGLTLFWPPLATMRGWPAPVWAYGVIAAFVVLRLWYTNHAFKTGDEFMRQRVRDASWRSYFIGQTLLLAYAGGERLGLFPPMNAWDVLVVMVAIGVVVPAFTPGRKLTA